MKVFYGPADIPTDFQKKINRTFGHQIPVWLDDIIIVTRCTKKQHTQKLESVIIKVELKGTKPVKRSQKSSRKKNIVAGTHHLARWNQTKRRENRRNQQTEPTFASRHLKDAKKHSVGELELLVVVWGLDLNSTFTANKFNYSQTT